MTQPLLPCPFCGGEPEVEPSYRRGQNEPSTVVVACRSDDCTVAVGARGDTVEEATKRWNERAGVFA